MLYVGFDLAFIDIIVLTEDEAGNLVDKLPPAGHHHRTSRVNQKAGGNSVNLAATLQKLGVENRLVIPSNSHFDELLDKMRLKTVYRLHTGINQTVAITWAAGEIQFNDAHQVLSQIHFSKEVYNYWIQSDLEILLNWGLNPGSVEWISCLWLASCGWTYEEIISCQNLIGCALKSDSLQYPLILEPGSIKSHIARKDLYKLLQHMSGCLYDEMYPVFLANEEEASEFKDLEFPTKIIHTEERVELYQNGHSVYRVPPLSSLKYLVGAGDAFLAGIVKRLIETKEIDIEFAIRTAQSHISGVW